MPIFRRRRFKVLVAGLAAALFDFLLMESGDYLLMESGDKFILEAS